MPCRILQGRTKPLYVAERHCMLCEVSIVHSMSRCSRDEDPAGSSGRSRQKQRQTQRQKR